MSQLPKNEISIREAQYEDAAEILRVHREAVHKTAARDYEQNILDVWSSNAPDRLARFQQQLQLNQDNSKMLVASVNNSIVGFAEVSLQTHEVKAVYVLPSSGRQGIGKQLLQQIENCARDNGLKDLWLDSSLNAERFYAANGFMVVEASWHSLRSGQKMPCTKMRKTL